MQHVPLLRCAVQRGSLAEASHVWVSQFLQQKGGVSAASAATKWCDRSLAFALGPSRGESM
eukprot:2610503-Amphidinium_carterae.1